MPEIRKVVATVNYTPEDLAELRNIFRDYPFVHVDRRDTASLEREIADADVAVLDGDLDDTVLKGKKLKWIHCDHAGLNRSARPEVFDRGILLTGSAGRSAPVLAEHCIFFMLSACYHVKELLAAQETRQWGVSGQEGWRGLYGRTAGILGMGNTGRQLAARLHAMGMRVLTYSRSRTEGFDFIERQYVFSEGGSFLPVLEESDFIIVCLPLTDQTYHLLDDGAFGHVKPGAMLVNISRGALTDTEAMVRALDRGILSCAGLDVFEQEPLPAESPLWGRKDVYITPHVTPQVPHRTAFCLNVIRENLRRYLNGEKLINQMDRRDVYTGGT